MIIIAWVRGRPVRIRFADAPVRKRDGVYSYRV
jgi:hypothetical protein